MEPLHDLTTQFTPNTIVENPPVGEAFDYFPFSAIMRQLLALHSAAAWKGTALLRHDIQVKLILALYEAIVAQSCKFIHWGPEICQNVFLQKSLPCSNQWGRQYPEHLALASSTQRSVLSSVATLTLYKLTLIPDDAPVCGTCRGLYSMS